MKRDRVVDLYGLVHYCEGTQVFMDTGAIVIKTSCGKSLTRHEDKTVKQLPLTCLACIIFEEKMQRLYERLDHRGRHARRTAGR
jgi:hypothetical protein